MDAAGRLEEIAARVRVCVRCRLHETRTHAVPGEGPSNAQIVLVGEAPGRTEDEQGRPFVGSAGKVLDNALRAAGLSRDSVFITNVIKCRPPGNRRPRKDEIETCLPYLQAQLEAIRPRIIVTLGETSLRALVPSEGPFAEVRGKRLKYEGIQVLPTYHPAAVLYNRPLERTLQADLREAAQRSRHGSAGETPPRRASSHRTAVSAGTAVVDRQGRVLLLHITRGRWCLPKGGIERGETLKDAAIRETQEETGLHVRLERRLTTIRYAFPSPKDHGTIHKQVTYYLARPVGGKIRLEPGFDRYRWATRGDALRLVRYANDREVLGRAFDRSQGPRTKRKTPGRAPEATH
jgi:uracil-DNA glycosylase